MIAVLEPLATVPGRRLRAGSKGVTMAGVPVRSGLRGERIAQSLDAVRLVVLLFLVLDVASTLTATIFGWTGYGPTGLMPVLHGLLVAVAAAAVMWHRWRWAAGPLVLVAGLAVLLGPSGLEFWLVLITAVAIALRWRGRRLLVGFAIHLTYAVLFGLGVHSREPGWWGWAAGLTTVAFSLAGFAIGLATRRALGVRDRWRERVEQVSLENVEIRAIERTRLADDLQVAMTRGLSRIDEIVAAMPPDADAAGLRRGLTAIDVRCRSLLAELRVLLEVLRDGTPSGDRAESSAPSLRRRPVMDRSVRVAVLVVLGVLAVRTLIDTGGLTGSASLVVEILGLAAAAVALYRPVPGMIIAAAALVAAALLEAPGHWDLLPTAVLSLAAALRLGLRGLGAALAGLGIYAGLLAVLGSSDPLAQLLPVGYVAVLAVITGLVIRHLHQVHGESGERVRDLLATRQGLAAAERVALARELHDVVAHQLTQATLLIMAAGDGADDDRLRLTLQEVGRETSAARCELDALLETMRTSTDHTEAAPDVPPAVTAELLAATLGGQGHPAKLDIDPASAGLDPTTTRTLGRIMREAGTNIARHAPSGSSCRFVLDVGEEDVRLEVASAGGAAAAGAHELSLGWGLRGIRERVQLVDGTFSAGPRDGSWVLTVRLPLIAAARSDVPAPTPRSLRTWAPTAAPSA